MVGAVFNGPVFSAGRTSNGLNWESRKVQLRISRAKRLIASCNHCVDFHLNECEFRKTSSFWTSLRCLCAFVRGSGMWNMLQRYINFFSHSFPKLTPNQQAAV
jgi:hypothetical protein